jgi:hypothetical protein
MTIESMSTSSFGDRQFDRLSSGHRHSFVELATLEVDNQNRISLIDDATRLEHVVLHIPMVVPELTTIACPLTFVRGPACPAHLH